MADRRKFMTGAVAFALMRGGAFPKLAADIPVPLHLDHGTPWTPVTIEGKGPFRFALGTGQTFFQVSTRLSRILNLTRMPQTTNAYSAAGSADFEIYQARELRLGDAYAIGDVAFMARPALDSTAYDGRLPFITQTATSFDFEAGQMTMLRDKAAPPEGSVKAPMIRPMARVFAKVPIVRAELDGNPLRLVIDTGMRSAISLHPYTVERLKLWSDDASTAIDDDPEVGGVEVQTTRARSLRFAGVDFSGPPVRLTRSEHAIVNPRLGSDGSVGMEILRRFQITFDPYKEVVWLKPNSRIGEPFA